MVKFASSCCSGDTMGSYVLMQKLDDPRGLRDLTKNII